MRTIGGTIIKIALSALFQIGLMGNAFVSAQAETQNSGNPSITIEKLLEYRSASKKEVIRERLWMSSVVKDRIRIHDVRLLSMYDFESEFSAYFRKGEVFEVCQGNEYGQIDTADGAFRRWLEIWGEDHVSLISSSGPNHAELVYPEKGIMVLVSGPHSDLLMIRIFHPMNLEDYKKYFWNDPGSMYDGTIE